MRSGADRLLCPPVQAVIKEVTDSNGKIVLFIDEIHLVVGAGATSVSHLFPCMLAFLQNLIQTGTIGAKLGFKVGRDRR